MIIADLRPYGDELTLEETRKETATVHFPSNFSNKTLTTDEIWITQWQQDFIFSSSSNKWDNYNSIPLKVVNS